MFYLLIPEVTQNKFFVSLFSFVSLIIMSLYLWTAFAPQAKGLEGHLKDCQKIGNHIVKLTIRTRTVSIKHSAR